MHALVDAVAIFSSRFSANWFVSKMSMTQLRLLSTKPNYLKITFNVALQAYDSEKIVVPL